VVAVYNTIIQLKDFLPAKQWASIAEAHQKISENELSCILVGIL